MESNRRWARGVVRAGALVGLVAAIAVLAGASSSASAPTADMAVTALKGPSGPVSRGSLVWFTQVIRNNGPEKVEMDTVPIVHGGRIRRAVCDLGISGDGPDCEYGFVSAGTRLVTKYEVKVTAEGGPLVFAAGVRTEQPELDDNPFNQYLSVSVPIKESD
jgi:hypothetical protein